MKLRKMIRFVVIACFTLCVDSALASDNSEQHSHIEESGLEFGISVGYAYLEEEKDSGAVLHAHLMNRLSDEGFLNYFSLGFGVETIFANEQHYGAMVTIAAHPWENTIFSLSPGVEWEKHEGETKSSYATHVEAAYVLEASGFHIGPVVGYSKTEDDEHYTIGVHIGIPL